MRAPGKFPILDALKASPRQLDACGLLAEAGLRGDDLAEVCRGRVGIETGSHLAVRIELTLGGTANVLPKVISSEEFSRIAQVEKECGILEVVGFLRDQLKEPSLHPSIAGYLLEHAAPETCRTLQLHGFTHTFSGLPRKSSGHLFTSSAKPGVDPHAIDVPGKPWQWYAVKLGKLTTR
jgi:hypothetical protein